jgi:site-specific DNA recombinase
MIRRRCAIYTRKSTDEGLDMAFNSLDAQREACEAYIKSQKAEGWVLLPDSYDDGGYSGGSMDRPGLRRLMADVEAGRIDIIIVYKVDRLTRALADFARIVDVLDAAGASFVSITQAFNTTTSMGRLTLNVLLSFAQFEREVGAERIRDKIAQSKARGIWMGGQLPLGYLVKDRKLIAVLEEANTVRQIFALYLEMPSVRALKEELDRRGIVTRLHHRGDKTTGGVPFGRGGLYHLLANPLYIGKLRHKDKLHDGEHHGIVPIALWEAVQARLAALSVDRGRSVSGGARALLTGLITDESGRTMSPTHAQKGQRRYHYYTSNSARDVNDGVAAGDSAPIVRIAQTYADAAVRHAVVQLLEPASIISLLDNAEISMRDVRAGLAMGRELQLALGPQSNIALRHLLDRCRFQLVLGHGRAQATVDRTAIVAMLLAQVQSPDLEPDPMPLDLPIVSVRRGNSVKLVLDPNVKAPSQPDPRLVRLLVNARQARAAAFAEGAKRPDAHQVRLARLAYLAPDITTAILEGRQPRALTSRALLKAPDLPMDWAAQRRMFGFRVMAG